MTGLVMDTVRGGNKDAFLSILFAPEAARPHLFALYAFATEIARIPALVSEPAIGEIRLQWWLDALVAIGRGETQSHPVAAALADAVSAHNLPIAPLSDLVQAHKFDLYADKMQNMNDVEGYLGETCSALFQLSCLVLDSTAALQTARASGLAGVALGFSRILCSPALSEKTLPAGQAPRDVIALAESRLADARQQIRGLPTHVLPAFLPLSVADTYLAAARRSATSVPQWKRQWRIWRAARSGKI